MKLSHANTNRLPRTLHQEVFPPRIHVSVIHWEQQSGDSMLASIPVGVRTVQRTVSEKEGLLVVCFG